MTQIKVSVIIPVYNAEEFLADCIQSLISQTLEECEFIFVNDGSTDSSQQIIKQFQEKDHRIILINQENVGRSAARNIGIIDATGRYIGFVDSDDFVLEEMFENLYNRATEFDTDIVISNYFLGRDDKYIIKNAIFPVNILYDQNFIQKNVIPNLLEREDLFAVWNKIYKRELIISHSIVFPNEYEEDQMFNLWVFNTVSNVLFIDYAGYFYREVFNGVSKNIFKIDYFGIARQKLHVDYKKRYNLTIPYGEFEKLKAIRFIQKVFYLLFKYATAEISFSDKLKKIQIMVFDPEVNMLSKKYHKDILKNQGIFEALVLKIIKNKSVAGLYLLVLAVKLTYHPKTSEIIRNLNNFKFKKT
ncbi:glycosyltransferase family 2 protein [Flavobacterium ranwuense]|nr:glycosyltransferase [Flavobacterium ranwuense]